MSHILNPSEMRINIQPTNSFHNILSCYFGLGLPNILKPAPSNKKNEYNLGNTQLHMRTWKQNMSTKWSKIDIYRRNSNTRITQAACLLRNVALIYTTYHSSDSSAKNTDCPTHVSIINLPASQTIISYNRRITAKRDATNNLTLLQEGMSVVLHILYPLVTKHTLPD